MCKSGLKSIVIAVVGLCLFTTGCWSINEGQTGGVENRTDDIRVASLSIFPEKWDKDANTRKIEKMIREAVGKGAQIVITPEGALEGYVVNEVINEKEPVRKKKLAEEFIRLAEPIDGERIRYFRNLANELDIYLVFGFLEADGGKLYNTAALLGPEGEIVGKYRKTHFWQGYEVNPPGYTAGDDYPVFDIGAFKIGIMICFDRQLPEPARILGLGGADLIACPAYGGWGQWNTKLMEVRAYENQVYVVFTHPEQSLFINRDGNLLKECRRDSFIIGEIPLSGHKKTRKSVIHRRVETYGPLLNEGQK